MLPMVLWVRRYMCNVICWLPEIEIKCADHLSPKKLFGAIYDLDCQEEWSDKVFG